MAVQTRSIQAGGGGDYTTISAWEAAAPTLGTDIWKGEIDDDSEYSETVTFSASGTASSTSYLWLTGGTNNRHTGVVGTGHPRVLSTSGTVFTIDTAFTRIEWVELHLNSTGGSDEGVRVNVGADDVLVSHCLVWAERGSTTDQDGVYTGNWSVARLRIDNCIVYGWSRAGIHIQQYSDSAGATVSVNVDHCTIYDCGGSSQGNTGAIYVSAEGVNDDITVDVYNTIGYLEYDTYSAFADGGNFVNRGAPDGTVTWNGSHNLRGDQGTNQIGGTDNTTSWQSATDGDSDTSQTSGSYVVFTSITSGSEDLRLLDDEAGNLAAGNGTNRQGSEPDSRQDFSVTVTGEARPTTNVDIGADQISSSADPANLAATVTDDDVALSWDL